MGHWWGMARSRFRSVAYDLDASVAVARAVAEAGGDTSPAAVANALGYGGTNNGAFLARLASARLFGLVAGRADRVLLTERGQALLGTEPAQMARARVGAFRAVPLYRAVLDGLSGSALPEPSVLADRLVADYGELPAKAPGVARRLVASAVQAGVVDGTNNQVSGGSPELYGSVIEASNLFVPPVRSLRYGRLGRQAVDEGGAPVAQTGWLDDGDGDGDGDGGLWLGEGAAGDPGALRDDARPPRSRPRHSRRAVTATVAVVTCMAAVGVPLGLVLTADGGIPAAAPATHHHLSTGPAKQQVLSALSATTDAGSFDFTYAMSQTAATTPASTTTTTTTCRTEPAPGVNRSGSSSPSAAVYLAPSTGAVIQVCSGTGQETENDRNRNVVSGSGVINTNPTGMLASTSLGITVRIDGTTVWEGSSDSLAPGTGQAGGGTPLAQFASLVQGTLGTRAGAAAMIGMASPTGYLDLSQQAVDAADQVGTGTVDGMPVTYYQVTLDPTALAEAPGITAQEATAIGNALKLLHAQGLQTLQDKIGIDGSGYIRSTTSVATFADGGTVALATTFSDFGCAGTVLMPGQQGSATPPVNCTSPDTWTPTTTTVPSASTTTTTTTTPIPTTTVPPASTTTEPLGSTTTTTSMVPPPTTTVPPASTTTTTTTT